MNAVNLTSTFLTLTIIIFFFKEGLGILDSVDPPSGSLIADFDGTENATTLTCNVTNSGGFRTSTAWLVQHFLGIAGLQIIHDDFFPDLFSVGGNPRPNDLNRTFRNQLTIVNLTSQLDNVVIYCGTGMNHQQANFLLRVYRPPSLADSVQMNILEGTQLMVDNLEMEPKTFPFPYFQWTKNSLVTRNISGVVYYGYPTVNFSNITRGDTGTYSLFAENTIIDSTRIIGNDTGSFFLNVLYGPEITEPVSNSFATLENDNVTLICGTDLTGNPKPTVEWFTNTGGKIADNVNDDRFSVSELGSDIVSLTIFDATLNDSGIWSCVVSSNLTTDQLQRNLTLTILVPPSEPLNFTLMSFGSTWIAVSWLEPAFIGVPEFMHYVISVEPTNTTNTNSLAKSALQNVNIEVDKGTRMVNVTKLFPGEEYQLSAVAMTVNSNVRAFSNSSATVFTTTHTTVPAILCSQTPTSANGSILVRWDYGHTGGLNLTGVSIGYQQGKSESFRPLVYGMESLQYSGEELLEAKNIRLINFTAGFEYVFRVTASNQNGYGSVECRPVQHLIGIPQQPEINSIASTSTGAALLDVITNEGGVQDDDVITFIVESELIDSSEKKTTFQEVSNYVDSSVTRLVVSGLTSGLEYQFTVRAQNKFGSSEYSEAVILTILTPGSAVSAQVVGGAVGGAVVLILIILVIISVAFILLLRANRKNKTDHVKKSETSKGKEISEDLEMIDNSLYDSKEGKSNNDKLGDKPTIEEVHYAAIPTFITTQEQQNDSNTVYESVMITPTHSQGTSTGHIVKQSDNPLYSSTQDLRKSIASSRANSLENVNAISGRSSPASYAHYDVPQIAGRLALQTADSPAANQVQHNNSMVSNRLSYGLELEWSYRQLPPRHTRSLSQGIDPLYTEL